jgi:hypothetical protein
VARTEAIDKAPNEDDSWQPKLGDYMLDRTHMAELLGSLGFKKIGRNVFKRTSSTAEVEHFFYAYPWGLRGEYLSADFGVRNPQAESFSIDCIRKFGGEGFSVLKHDARLDCKMRFPFGKVAGWQPRWSLDTSLGDATLRRLVSDIKTYLIPVYEKISTRHELMEFLIADKEPGSWLHVSRAIRATQVAYLQTVGGLGWQEVLRTLTGFRESIQPSISKEASALEYIDSVMSLLRTLEVSK